MKRGACNAPNNLTCAFKSAHEGRHVNIPVGPRSPSLSCPNCPIFPLSIYPKCLVHSDLAPRATVSWHDRQFGPCPFPRAATLTFAQSLIPLENGKNKIKKKKKKKRKEKEERELIFWKIIFFFLLYLLINYYYFFFLHKIYNSTSLKLIWLFLLETHLGDNLYLFGRRDL